MSDVVWALTLCLAAVAALLVLRRRTPVAFWLLVGFPIVALRVLATYRATMDACGLTVPASAVRRATARLVGREAAPVPPAPLIATADRGLVMKLRMATGQAPEDFFASADRLRHAWAAHAVHIRPTRPGWIELRLIGWDVLADVRRPRRKPDGGGLLSLPLALRDDGRWHVRDFRTVPHELILGATQSGKSVYLRNLLCGLARQPVVLVGIDCKWGVELAPFAPRLSALADTPDRANALLDALLDEMEARFRLIGMTSVLGADAVLTSDVWGLPDSDRPVPVVVVVDEVAELFLAANRDDEKRRDAMVTKLIRIAQLGRAGIYLEVCGQRFGSELGKGATMLRAQLTGRVCHRVNDESSANMALADISAEAALAATAIPADLPGVAIVGDASGGWSRARSPHLTLDDAAAVCRATSGLVPELPRLDAFRPTASIVAVEAVPSTGPVARPVTD